DGAYPSYRITGHALLPQTAPQLPPYLANLGSLPGPPRTRFPPRPRRIEPACVLGHLRRVDVRKGKVLRPSPLTSEFSCEGAALRCRPRPTIPNPVLLCGPYRAIRCRAKPCVKLLRGSG